MPSDDTAISAIPASRCCNSRHRSTKSLNSHYCQCLPHPGIACTKVTKYLWYLEGHGSGEIVSLDVLVFHGTSIGKTVIGLNGRMAV